MRNLSITGTSLPKSEPQIRNDQTSLHRLHSPLKRTVLTDIENLPPSSPDLLTVPETPSSQIRLAPSSSETNRQSLAKVIQLSPICRSPRYKEPGVRGVMTSEGGGPGREEGASGSLKRLFSPPEVSHLAKRPRIVFRPTGCNQKPVPDLPEGHCQATDLGFNDSRTLRPVNCHSLGELRPEDETGSGFTVITEQKAAETKSSSHLEKDARSVASCVRELAAPQRHEDEPNGTEVTRATMTSDGDGVTSDQDQAAGLFMV